MTELRVRGNEYHAVTVGVLQVIAIDSPARWSVSIFRSERGSVFAVWRAPHVRAVYTSRRMSFLRRNAAWSPAFSALGESNHLFRATRPIEKQKRDRNRQKHTQNHKQTDGQTDKTKQTTSTNYKLTTSTTSLLLLLLFLHNTAKWQFIQYAIWLEE